MRLVVTALWLLWVSHCVANTPPRPPHTLPDKPMQIRRPVSKPKPKSKPQPAKPRASTPSAPAEQLNINISKAAYNYEGFMKSSKLSSGPAPRGSPPGWPCIGVEQMLKTFVSHDSEVSHFIVNVGAQEGDAHDPAYNLHKNNHFGGLMFEGDDKFFDALDRNMNAINQSGNIFIHHDFVYPHTIEELLDSYAVPKQFAFLKVDIDSVDLGVTRRILQAGYEPGIVMVEINPGIPPPIHYEVLSLGDNDAGAQFVTQSNFRQLSHHGGSSATAAFNSLIPFDYVLIGVELGSTRGRCMQCEHNMYFARGSNFRAVLPHVTPPSFLQMSEAFWHNQNRFFHGKKPGCLPSAMCPVHRLVHHYCTFRTSSCSKGKLGSYSDMSMFYHMSYADAINFEHVNTTLTSICDEIKGMFGAEDKIRCDQG